MLYADSYMDEKEVGFLIAHFALLCGDIFEEILPDSYLLRVVTAK